MAAPLVGVAVKAGKALAATVSPSSILRFGIILIMIPLTLVLVFIIPISMILTVPNVDTSDINLYKTVVAKINTEKSVQLQFQQLIAIDAALNDQIFTDVSESTIKTLANKFLWSEEKTEEYKETEYYQVEESKLNPVTKKMEKVKVTKSKEVTKTRTVTVWHVYPLDTVLNSLISEGKIIDKQEVLNYMSVDVNYFEMQTLDLPDNWTPGGTGEYEWPTPGYFGLDAIFGMRIHPIKKIAKFHNGLDIDAPMGAPIVSSKDGLVTRASYAGDSGNSIVIINLDKTENRYLHLSSYKVKKGDVVKKGEIIGYVGSTGLSTGPHLHYEIRIKGNPTNPLDYFR